MQNLFGLFLVTSGSQLDGETIIIMSAMVGRLVSDTQN